MQEIYNSSIFSQLEEINKKYATASFNDINIIKLFGLDDNKPCTINNIDIIKRKFTAKYYNLSLKYHPNKFTNTSQNIIQIINCGINIADITNGLFQSFITEIYELLTNLFKNEPNILIDIINGDMDGLESKNVISRDFINLKSTYSNNNDRQYMKPSKEQFYKFQELMSAEKAIDTKLSIEDTNKLYTDKLNVREELKIDDDLSNKIQNKKPEEFNKMFNDYFEAKKNDTVVNMEHHEPTNRDQLICFDSEPYNGSIIDTTLSITDLNEAFKPIEVLKVNKQQLTYDELQLQRANEDQKLAKTIKNKIKLG